MRTSAKGWTLAAVLVVAASAAASAAPVGWTDWTSAAPGIPGAASGTIVLADGTALSVSYSGDINFAQTAGGTNFWIPPEPYLSATVSNPPLTSDIIALTGGSSTVNSLTFSVPVVDPVLAILSLGNEATVVRYQFDAAFDVLSSGYGWWGQGLFIELPDNVLEGKEGHGAIGFKGTFTSISWTVPTYEYWHGFTLGIPGATTPPVPVPLPAALPLFLSGLAGFGVIARCRGRRAV